MGAYPYHSILLNLWGSEVMSHAWLGFDVEKNEAYRANSLITFLANVNGCDVARGYPP